MTVFKIFFYKFSSANLNSVQEMVFLPLIKNVWVMSVNSLPHSFLGFSCPLLLVRVLQRKLQFGPELGLSAAQSL